MPAQKHIPDLQTPYRPPPVPHRASAMFKRTLLVGVLATIGAISLISWLFMVSSQTEIAGHAERQAAKIARSLSSWTLAGTHLSPAITPGPSSGAPFLSQASERAALNTHVRSVSTTTPLLLLRLYDGAGQLIYSTDPKELPGDPAFGQDFVANPPASLSPSQNTQTSYAFFDQVRTSRQAFSLYLPLDGQGWANIHLDLSNEFSALDLEFQRFLSGTIMVMIALLGAISLLIRSFARYSGLLEGELTATQANLRGLEGRLRDIQSTTERSIAERTLRVQQSEARFREFAESASDWLWECDEEGRITYVSEGFSRITGVERKDILGRYRWQLSQNPTDEQKWKSHTELMRAMRPFRDFTYSLKVGPDRSRVVSLNGTPIFDEHARFRGYRGTGSDITPQHEAKQTILHLGRVLEQSSSELFLVDGNSLQILQANRGARKNLGYSSEDLAQMTLLDILPTEGQASLSARFGRLRLHPGDIASFETLQERKDGSRYPVEARIQYMAQEEPPIFVVVAQNITARKQAEQALAESEERYRSVAEMNLDAIIVHVEGTIVYANLQATTVFRADGPAALIGQTITSFVPTENRDMLSAVFFPPRQDRKALITPPKRTELHLLHADGETTFSAELSSLAITFGGRPAIQTVIRDVTQTKAYQSQLTQATKLATLGEMAAGMAHELSQPINVVRMAAEAILFEKDDNGFDPAMIEAQMDKIIGQASRMGEIIDHMRIFSRQQSDEVTVFDAVPCAHQAIAMLETQMRGDDIDLIVECLDEKALIKGRPVHLEQVLLNLLANARDSVRSHLADLARATGNPRLVPRGKITLRLITTDAPRALENAPGDWDDLNHASEFLEISVEDSGTGIPENLVDRIFEPFFTTKEVGTGTGLGLSVSFGLIASMRGAMQAFNTAEGACFRIDLPLASPSDIEQHAKATTESPLPTPPRTAKDDDEDSALVAHIMVVDDETDALALMTNHLRRLGYRVSAAENGEEAYEIFVEDPADLVITDLRMPACDGQTLIKRLHDIVPDLPVIVATGHLGELEAAAADLKAVTVALLKKPISLAKLGDLVRTHADLGI